MKKTIVLVAVSALLLALAPAAQAAEPIDPTDFLATASSMHDQPAEYYGPQDAVNGYGLKGTDPETHGAKNPEYNSLDQWLSQEPFAGEEWVKVDMGALYRLDTLNFWNGSFRGEHPEHGVDQADIYYSTSVDDPGDDFSDPKWKLMGIAGEQTFTEVPATGADFEATDVIELGGINAQWFALDIKTAQGGPEYTGWVAIAEMQFIGTLVTSVPGDVDGDGDVDLADVGYFEAQFGMSGLPVPPVDLNSADLDADGDVDLHDLVFIRDGFGFVTPEAPAAATPEPATMTVLAIGGLLVLRRRRLRINSQQPTRNVQ